MVESCGMCDKRRVASPPDGVFLRGEWFCSEKCKHGGKALHTIDELVDLVRMAFGEEPETMRKFRESVQRTLDSL